MTNNNLDLAKDDFLESISEWYNDKSDSQTRIKELEEKCELLESENYDLKEEIKEYSDESERYVYSSNYLSCFDDETDYIPVSHIGDTMHHKTVVEVQTGDEDLNNRIVELITILLNKGLL